MTDSALFIPTFSQVIILVICVPIFGGSGELFADRQVLSGILYACATFCAVVAFAWVRMLIAERVT